ncbi:hypothetical protein BKA67DRAFT_581964 [Truncatella angustata]|uniref:Fibronectin type III-like domain-containing protein n=1 Tax=Truncatella angustata TaxID=152316 RepID=A0A9P8UD63_9PEZI|nr:uncharacterized protein BKA67DRAFT_581964 [Truncatella angustata]KAH6647210.1 hypothetical protein BKA67DRAFT_581964 [Truncatella angustata]
MIKAGETTNVYFPLMRKELSVWDVVAQKWLLRSGDYNILTESFGPSRRVNTGKGRVQTDKPHNQEWEMLYTIVFDCPTKPGVAKHPRLKIWTAE